MTSDELKVAALDALALALANHNHQWTNRERFLYEDAIAISGRTVGTADKTITAVIKTEKR